MSQSTNSTKQEKKQKDFSHMSRFDVAGLVANTALMARDSGHQVVVRHARVEGQRGILVFIPGFELHDGNLSLVDESEAVAA